MSEENQDKKPEKTESPDILKDLERAYKNVESLKKSVSHRKIMLAIEKKLSREKE